MITDLLSRLFGTNNRRQLKKIQPIVDQINSFEPEISGLSDAALALKTNQFRQQISQGRSLDDILPEAFAVVRETAKRQLGQRHYDVQLIGGIVLHQGKITEMKTGEGKTLTATLPLYLNALPGKGAHLVTVNDYLAQRDANWMKPIYNFLGLSVGCLQHNMSDRARKEQYAADILYATNNELGFDYLRDNMKFRLTDYVQRELVYAIVDEVDSILIDEARTPLIISGATEESSQLYISADRAIKRLKKGDDYEVDEKQRNVHLTESGIDKIEQSFNVQNLYVLENVTLLHHAMQALKAHVLFARDVEYVVKDGEVLIVDEFTGRILPGRRYSDGLHQAIEAKEGVEIEQETQTLASITLQNFFRLYKKLSGMTGTALTESEEFYKIYQLDVISIPTNVSVIRKDLDDLIFLTERAKFQAVVADIKNRYKKGQPVLIGTVAIETSERLSNYLTMNGVPHEVLNAKQHMREAEIIEHAGESGKITIATNMAGRGTDIKLTPEAREVGGLYILGTERHESRRIDNQLRGRSGRQGDPGESRFYISLEDPLVHRFGGENLKKYMVRLGMQEDEIIESPIISRAIENAQEKVEKMNFEMRKHLLEYDNVLNQQRMVIYNFRREVLEGEEQLYDLMRDMIIKMVQDMMAHVCNGRMVTDEQLEALHTIVSNTTGLSIQEIQQAGISSRNAEVLTSDIINFLLQNYTLYRNQSISMHYHTIEEADEVEGDHAHDTERIPVQQSVIKEAEKWLLLETIDHAWKQHMLNLDYLKEGINLRSWGQKNPLIEYKKEAFDMFQDMIRSIRADVVHHIFHLNLQRFNKHELEKRREEELGQMLLSSSEAQVSEQGAHQQRINDKIGRNDPCVCGSGKKYKKCCG